MGHLNEECGMFEGSEGRRLNRWASERRKSSLPLLVTPGVRFGAGIVIDDLRKEATILGKSLEI